MKMTEIRTVALTQDEHYVQPLQDELEMATAINELDELQHGAGVSKKIAKKESKNNATIIDRAMWSLPAVSVEGLGTPEKLRVSAEVVPDDRDSLVVAANNLEWSRHPRGSVLPWYVIGE